MASYTIRRLRFFTLSVVLIILPGLTSGQPEQPMAWVDDLLHQAQLKREQTILEPNRWAEGGRYRLETFQRLWDDWRLIDPFGQRAARDLLAAAPRFASLIAVAAPLIDVKLPETKAQPNRPQGGEILSQSIQALHVALQKPLTAEQKQDLLRRCQPVPSNVAAAAAVLIDALPNALTKRNRAIAKLGTPDKLQGFYDRARELALDYGVNAETLKLMADVDLPLLMEGGHDLARAMDEAVGLLGQGSSERFSLTWGTPIGAIALNGSQDNVYGEGPYLFILDTGGNDKYASGAGNQSAQHPIALLLDLGGDDAYDSKKSPAFGAGILGYALHQDTGGKDHYKAETLACGMASFGVGILIDRDGDDHYELDRVGQGAGYYGVGILSDHAGKDTYDCYQMAQGYGGVKGCGILIDVAGNDQYTANDTKISYPSPQTADHNTSLAQGCSFGRRAHPGDGHSLAGGVGMLVDGQGDDRYQCGLFGQGVSYWYGLGLLVDLEGHDTYKGIWYCQGSAAHYGVGGLIDMAGNDHYSTQLTMGQGAGHDYSNAWLHDGGGKDTYECPGNCMGFALYNGVGVLWDASGDDVYKTSGASFGATGETRPEHNCFGLFYDAGGNNTFPAGSLAKNKSHWMQPPIKGQPQSHGVGAAR